MSLPLTSSPVVSPPALLLPRRRRGAQPGNRNAYSFREKLVTGDFYSVQASSRLDQSHPFQPPGGNCSSIVPQKQLFLLSRFLYLMVFFAIFALFAVQCFFHLLAPLTS